MPGLNTRLVFWTGQNSADWTEFSALSYRIQNEKKKKNSYEYTIKHATFWRTFGFWSPGV